jgi:hypothetical protein
VIDREAFPPQQHMQPSVAKPAPLSGQLGEPQPDPLVIFGRAACT